MTPEEIHVLAVRDSLRRVGADPDLSDSIGFLRRVEGSSPAAPGFDQQVAAAAREFVGPDPAEAAAEAAERERKRAAAEASMAAARRHDPSYQWTQSDAEAATQEEFAAAYRRGQLTALVGPAKPRPEPRRRIPRTPMPSPAQVARWSRMLPWEARRARAEWARQHSASGGGGAA